MVSHSSGKEGRTNEEKLVQLSDVQSLDPTAAWTPCSCLDLRKERVNKSFTLPGRGHAWYFMSVQPNSEKSSWLRLDHKQGCLWDLSLQRSSRTNSGNYL